MLSVTIDKIIMLQTKELLIININIVYIVQTISDNNFSFFLCFGLIIGLLTVSAGANKYIEVKDKIDINTFDNVSISKVENMYGINIKQKVLDT